MGTDDLVTRTFRAPTQHDVATLFGEDAREARERGLRPVEQFWSRNAREFVLTVRYAGNPDRAQRPRPNRMWPIGTVVALLFL